MLDRIEKLERANNALLKKVRRLEGELAAERGDGVDAMGRKRRRVDAVTVIQTQPQPTGDEEEEEGDEQGSEEEEEEVVPEEDLTWGDGSDDEDYEAPEDGEEEEEEEEDQSELGELVPEDDMWDPGADYSLPEGYNFQQQQQYGGQGTGNGVPAIDLTKMNAAALQELARLLQLATGGQA